MLAQVSQEKLSLEKDIAQCVDSKKNTQNALVESNSSLEELKGQLQLAQDELQKLRKDLSGVNEGEPLIVFPPSKDYTGIAKLYDEAGDLQYEIPFKDGNKEGTEIEYVEEYHGRIVIRETPYKDGKKEGTEVEYNDYGDMPETATPYKNGKKEGVQKNWEGEGDFGGSSDITYVDDKVEGICVYRDHYWGTWIEEVILDGKKVSQISYDWGGGEVIWGVVYKDGKIDEGTMHTYEGEAGEDGERIQSITIYKSGQIVSEKCMTCCDDNGEEYEIPCD